MLYFWTRRRLAWSEIVVIVQLRMRYFVKIKYLLLLLLSFTLVSCSKSPMVTEIDYPDEEDLGTLIAKTLTQIAADNPEATQVPTDTPQPVEQDSTGPPTAQFFTLTPTEQSPAHTLTKALTEAVSTGESPLQPTALTDPTEESFPLIGVPGLDRGVVLEQMIGIGFECSQPYAQDDMILNECKYGTSDFLYTISIWGGSADAVDLIEAVGFYFGDLDYTELTSIIFELLVVSSNLGAESGEAGRWIIDTLPDIQQVGDESIQYFGGVRYYLYAFPSAHVLEIGGLH